LAYRVGWMNGKQAVLNKAHSPCALLRLIVEDGEEWEEEKVVFAVPERSVAEQLCNHIKARVQAAKGGAMADPRDASMLFSHSSLSAIIN